MPTVDISIIIISKNGEKYIGSTLDMIFKQNIDRQYEVVIIDSGSRDSTLEIAKRYPVKILEIPPSEFGHGKTRNLGAKIANGEIIVFLNGDATPMDQDWLKSLIANFKNDERVSGVYSHVYPCQNCNPLRFWEILNEYTNEKEIKYIKNFDVYRDTRPKYKRKFLTFQTVSCAIRKDFLLHYPFKDIEFGEDLEWSKRMMEAGFKIVFEPESIVLHSHNFYYSFFKTFKRYFDDAKLNNYLLNIWSWRNFPRLCGCIIYKILRDIHYVSSLNQGLLYKIGWLFYSPIIRLAEFFGIIAGANSKYLPQRFHSLFSLVNEIKRN